MAGGPAGGGAGGGGRITLKHVELTLEELYRGTTKVEKLGGKSYTLQIQRGWKAGTKLKFDNDRTVFEVREQTHATFARVGNDLHISVFPSSPLSFVRGEELEVRALDERRVRVRIPAFSLSVTVAGEGMPHKAGPGDLVVHWLANKADVMGQVRQWGTILMGLLMLWLFLTNPTLAIMIFFGFNAIMRQAQ